MYTKNDKGPRRTAGKEYFGSYARGKGKEYGKDYGKETGREGRGYSARSSEKRSEGGREKKEYRAEKKPAVKPERRPAEPKQTEEDELPFLIFGRNAVREAVKAGRSIDKILVNKEQDGSLREILDLARERKLVIREVEREKLDEVCLPFGHGAKTGNHQGIVAYMAGVEYCELSDILADAREKGEPPFVIVLDGVEDPHNLGSIIRSADLAGAHGVVIGKRRSASVTAAAVKASAGAAEHMRIARVVNISAAVETLKKEGLWAAGADMAGDSVYEKDMKGALALVIGSEGEGISRLVREKCDFLVSIPMSGHIDSLNAGVAAGILMFEKRRQERGV